MTTSQTTSPTAALTRTTLANGLRVVLAPDRSAPVVGVAVHYDVGIRSEPEGRTGFAHLFEHLMFQGSANVAKTEHFTLIQGAGGTLNGSTHLDYTDYYEALPSGALELALYLEADRMRALRLTPENLANQVEVVSEEIRVNVDNRPYGGFPWILLPPVLFTTFPNAHNGYGDFADLQAATIEDAEGFFARYYAPGNAVLTVAGDLDPDATLAMVERHFGTIPGRGVPPRPSFAEPPPDGERRAVHTDPLAPRPAVAVGYRVPDPLGPLEAYLPFVVLGEVLSDGDASRLQQRLVQRDGLATDLSAGVGIMGGAFDVRDPTAFVFEARHPAEVAVDDLLAAFSEELDRLATDGIGRDELARVTARFAARELRRTDSVLGRARSLTIFEQQRGAPELVGGRAARVREVEPEAVAAAAAALRPDARAVLELRPGGAA
jgi:predicted Zn-dependent peptidase